MRNGTHKAFHSQFIYGEPVETRKPYPRYYMKIGILLLDDLSISWNFMFTTRMLKLKRFK